MSTSIKGTERDRRWETYLVLTLVAILVVGLIGWIAYDMLYPKILRFEVSVTPITSTVTADAIEKCLSIKVGDRWNWKSDSSNEIQDSIAKYYDSIERKRPQLEISQSKAVVTIKVEEPPISDDRERTPNNGLDSLTTAKNSNRSDVVETVVKPMQDIITAYGINQAVDTLLFEKDNQMVGLQLSLMDHHGDQALKTIYIADELKILDLQSLRTTGRKFKTGGDYDKWKFNLKSEIDKNFEVKAGVSITAYWKAYINWYHLLALLHAPDAWKHNGQGVVHLNKLLTASSGWKAKDTPNDENHIDGSIITAGLFVLLSLDSGYYRTETADTDQMAKILGSSRFGPTNKAFRDRPLCTLLEKLCSLADEINGGQVPPGGRFKYDPNDGGSHQLQGGLALYYIAKAVLARESKISPDKSPSKEDIEVIRAEMQPNILSARKVINHIRGNNEAPFSSLKGYYQTCYVSRALALLIRNENSHGNVVASTELIKMANELLITCKQMERKTLIGNDYSHYYIKLAESCLIRELMDDVNRFEEKGQALPNTNANVK